MKTLAIVQARIGSSRLPGKVMKSINGEPMIQILLERLSLSKKIDHIVVAISDQPSDDVLNEHLEKIKFSVFRGSENNVLKRYVDAAKDYEAETIVRITGDCPLIDPHLVDCIIDKFFSEKLDYCTNTMPPTYPDGLDVEVFTRKVLFEAEKLSYKASDFEHVTPSIRERKDINISNLRYDKDLSNLRWTVDEQSDFNLVHDIFKNFFPRKDFSWLEVLKFYESNKEIFNVNDNIKRNEGKYMGKGQKLWKRAKNVIPGGNMLLSKRSEMFLPEKWPSYFSKAKGCHVWDLDGKRYTDVSIMGIGTNTLGYGNEEVDASVLETISSGNMSTLNCPEEVYLAEKLIEINSWAGMVRFARSGGEANSIAVRIARAATGKDNVAICGYHGWHDWYLAVNHKSPDSLKDHLLPGLNPSGVPKSLAGTVFPFDYNDFDTLQNLVENHNIGTIKMEVERTEKPKQDFLLKVRQLADEKNIVLIFDECTSGFRETFGGLHKKYNVEPDLAMYGKTLGNGYAITAVVGKSEVMQACQSTFISSTFWTERIGPTAALSSLRVMERIESWKKISAIGKKVSNAWNGLAKKNELSLIIKGIDALPTFSFDHVENLKYKTYLTQEMLKRGYLANTSFYACIDHDDEVLESYFHDLDSIFLEIKKCQTGQDIDNLLDGPVCHDGFKRLN